LPTSLSLRLGVISTPAPVIKVLESGTLFLPLKKVTIPIFFRKKSEHVCLQEVTKSTEGENSVTSGSRCYRIS